MTVQDLQKTDDIVVDIVNQKLKVIPQITANDINRSHIIGEIKSGKGQIICRFRNWKLKNAIYMAKKNLRYHSQNIFVTEDLTKFRQSIIKQLSVYKKLILVL